MGIDPITSRMQSERSTIWAKSPSLPAGIEPATSRLTAVHSTNWVIGAGGF